MKTLEKGQDRVKHICNVLRKETLEPAKCEAEKIIADAKKDAEAIIEKAKKDAEGILKTAKNTVEQERRVFQSSLRQSCKQSVEELKQTVENKLFNTELCKVVADATKDPKIIASLVTTLIEAIKNDGVDTDLSAIIPSTVSASDVNAVLMDGILGRLRENEVVVGEFQGGAMVRLHDKQVTLDISDNALKELLGSYLRKDFRDVLFKS